MTQASRTSRGVSLVTRSVRTPEGDGFVVHRSFPGRGLDQVDPFLLLDEMGPLDLEPGATRGFPDHPHRGFETVTYLLEGAMEHRDSAGHAGRLGPGDVQWMTAGAGVVHSEMPAADIRRTGGRLHGFQLWVNLPRKDKMIPPRYQEILSRSIPEATSPDGLVRVRVIAGEALGVKAVIDTRTPIEYLHVTVQPGGCLVQPVAPTHEAFVYVFGGGGRVGEGAEPVSRGDIVRLSRDGEDVCLEVPADASAPMEALLIAGVPIGEPVARHGPFVMTTQAEIIQAVEDYRAGRMGRIDA